MIPDRSREHDDRVGGRGSGSAHHQASCRPAEAARRRRRVRARPPAPRRIGSVTTKGGARPRKADLTPARRAWSPFQACGPSIPSPDLRRLTALGTTLMHEHLAVGYPAGSSPRGVDRAVRREHAVALHRADAGAQGSRAPDARRPVSDRPRTRRRADGGGGVRGAACTSCARPVSTRKRTGAAGVLQVPPALRATPLGEMTRALRARARARASTAPASAPASSRWRPDADGSRRTRRPCCARRRARTGRPVRQSRRTPIEGTMGPEQLDDARERGRRSACRRRRPLLRRERRALPPRRCSIAARTSASTVSVSRSSTRIATRLAVLIGLLGVGFERQLVLSHDTVWCWRGRAPTLPPSLRSRLEAHVRLRDDRPAACAAAGVSEREDPHHAGGESPPLLRGGRAVGHGRPRAPVPPPGRPGTRLRLRLGAEVTVPSRPDVSSRRSQAPPPRPRPARRRHRRRRCGGANAPAKRRRVSGEDRLRRRWRRGRRCGRGRRGRRDLARAGRARGAAR